MEIYNIIDKEGISFIEKIISYMVFIFILKLILLFILNIQFYIA